MPLQHRLDELRTRLEAAAPPGTNEISHRALDELARSGAVDRVRKVGELAPSFALKESNGAEVRSTNLLANGPLVVTFYRGVWCPYCNLDLQSLRDALPEISSRGARLVSISPQNAANSRKAVRQHDLTFPLLSDPHGEVASAFGVRWQMQDYYVDLYKNTFKVDLAAFNDDDSWTLPMPSRFVIGRDGVIAYSEVSPDYTRRPDPADLLPVLDRLRER